MPSPFYEKSSEPDGPQFTVRKVGQPNIVEVPISVLEDWISALEVAENDGDVEDVLHDMRSRFRG